jgi:hypothetical protein
MPSLGRMEAMEGAVESRVLREGGGGVAAPGSQQPLQAGNSGVVVPFPLLQVQVMLPPGAVALTQDFCTNQVELMIQRSSPPVAGSTSACGFVGEKAEPTRPTFSRAPST